MSIPDYIDEYFVLKNSDAHQNWLRGVAKANSQFAEQRGIKTQRELDAFIERTEQYWSDAKRDHARATDKILELYNFSVAEIEAAKADRARKSAGGKSPKLAAKNRKLVLQAFLECEARGLSYAEAIKAAVAVEPDLNPRTFRTWLSELIRLGVCDIPSATRKKK